MTKSPLTFTAQTIVGFNMTGLSQDQLDKFVSNSQRINFALGDALRHELHLTGIHGVHPELMSSLDVREAITDIVRRATPAAVDEPLGRAKAELHVDEPLAKVVEPGQLLRHFVRGFLRDHLGMSKIVAHLLADLFMVRWRTARADGTAKRYVDEMEDVHTLAVTFDRKALQRTDELTGITEKDKADMEQGKLPRDLGLRFPDRAVGFDPKHRLYSAGR